MGAVLMGALSASAVNEPVLVSTSPKPGGFSTPANAATITATYDRDLATPSSHTFVVRDSDGAAVTGTVLLSSARTIGFSPASPLGEGSYSATVTVAPAVAGDPKTSTFGFTIDATAPAAPEVTYPANGTLTKEASILIQGDAEPSSTLRIKDGPRSVATIPVLNNGQYSLSIGMPGSENGVVHDFVFTATDRAGNLGEPTTHRIVYDNVAPTPPTMSIALEGSKATMWGTAEPGILIDVGRCYLNGFLNPASFGTTHADASGNWSVTAVLEDGRHAIVASAVDEAGNYALVTKEVLVDVSPPAAPVITVPAPGARITGVRTALAGHSEPGSIVTVRNGVASLGSATANGAGDWSMWAPLDDGSYTISATARDEGGNVSSVSDARSFLVEVDVTPPTIEVTTANGTTFLPGSPFEVRGSARDNRRVNDVVIAVYDARGSRITTRSAVLGSPGTGSSSWSFAFALPPGVYEIQSYAVDSAALRSAVSSRSLVVLS